MLIAPPIAAHAYRSGALVIDHPWTRQTAVGQSVGGGYMTIENKGRLPEQLLSGSTPVAARVEIHMISIEGGVMRMRELKDGLAIPAQGSIALKPGSYHIMLLGLKQQLLPGARIPLTLRFRRAGSVDVSLAVEAVSYRGPEARHAGH
jgi:copper(I)-binding protein